MKYIVLPALFFLCVPLMAQQVTKTTHTYAGDLQLDIYQAETNDQPDKPLLIFMHGGGFSGGARDNEVAADFCTSMASEGFVVASLTYRLLMKGRGFGCDIPAADKIATFREAGRDGARATAYLLSESARLGIDPTKVVLSGSSAGAEAILHLAFWDETRKTESGRLLPEDFKYAGAISFAGAIMDLGLITSGNAVPLMLVHGTCDDLVPYATAPHHYCGYEDPGYLVLNGAGSMAAHYEDLGASYALYTICGGDHAWAGTPMTSMQSETAAFIRDYIVAGEGRQSHVWKTSAESCTYPGAMVCEN